LTPMAPGCELRHAAEPERVELVAQIVLEEVLARKAVTLGFSALSRANIQQFSDLTDKSGPVARRATVAIRLNCAT
jgi:hypothetical protein